MKVLKKDSNWIIVTADDLEGFEAWCQSEIYVKKDGIWECRSCFGGKPKFKEELENGK